MCESVNLHHFINNKNHRHYHLIIEIIQFLFASHQYKKKEDYIWPIYISKKKIEHELKIKDLTFRFSKNSGEHYF